MQLEMQGWLMGAIVRGGSYIFCASCWPEPGPSFCALPDYACHVPTSTAIHQMATHYPIQCPPIPVQYQVSTEYQCLF
ncbi:hypothetical protein ANO14919_145370 [Xylariales sp. No.14919]|nr:hypothetical protein ANO14919_145370 [Xylariales sp. No.14919]